MGEALHTGVLGVGNRRFGCFDLPIVVVHIFNDIIVSNNRFLSLHVTLYLNITL